MSAIGLAECAMLVLLMRYLFQIPIAGSLWLFFGVVPVFVLIPLGLGFFVAAQARNHSEAIRFGNLILLPSFLLSGFMFPVEFLKFPFDRISRVMPTSHLVSLSRDVILRGALATDIAPEIIVAVVFSVGLCGFGFWRLCGSLAVG